MSERVPSRPLSAIFACIAILIFVATFHTIKPIVRVITPSIETGEHIECDDYAATSSCRYVIVVEITRDVKTLNLKDQLTAYSGSIRFSIPVDQEFYDAIKVGQYITNYGQIGTFNEQGSFNSWLIRVADKHPQ